MKHDQPNTLVVRVNSPFEPLTEWPEKKTLIKGIFNQDRSRPGSAWKTAGQEYNTGGIWNDVWLEASSFLTVDSLRLAAKWDNLLPRFNSPEVSAYLSLINRSDQPADVQVRLVLIPDNFVGENLLLPPQDIHLSPGKNEINLAGVVQNPALWWSWDRGDPNLYLATAQVLQNGSLVAEKQVRFGFREIRVEEGWAWYLNGQRFFVRGTNYASTKYL